MEQIHTSLSKAENHLKIAEYIFTKTYPVIKEPKLFLSILHNIEEAVKQATNALIRKAVVDKKISKTEAETQKKAETLKKIGKEYKIQQELLLFAQTLQKLVQEQKNAPVEFKRQKRFIICSDDYKIKSLDEKMIRDCLFKAKIFIDKTKQVARREC